MLLLPEGQMNEVCLQRTAQQAIVKFYVVHNLGTARGFGPKRINRPNKIYL